jgi:hypothetical protein
MHLAKLALSQDAEAHGQPDEHNRRTNGDLYEEL